MWRSASVFGISLGILLTTVSPAGAEPDAPVTAAQTGGRAVVVVEGGGGPHAFTTPWDACDSGRPTYIQALVDAGLPVFTAPGYGNVAPSTYGKTGCPLQPPVEVQWNTGAYPTQAGQAVLGFLGYLNATYGYTTFDLVGYSYGGVVARATIAALKRQSPAASVAPGFSYSRSAVDAGVKIPTLTTMASPHLGSPTYDIVADPSRYFPLVAKAWGRQFADAGRGLIPFERDGGAGALRFTTTFGHAEMSPTSWDVQQVGALDGVAVTLMAANYCGRSCGDADTPPDPIPRGRLRHDGSVPVYSQLILPCPQICPTPPGSVYVPPGMLPTTVVREVFPAVHSRYEAIRLGLPPILSISEYPASVGYLVSTVRGAWDAARTPVLPRP
jgi:triacylglycerol lipase